MSKLFERFNSLVKYAIASLLVAIPLYPKFPAIRIPGTYVSVRLEDFLLAVVALVALIRFWPELKGWLKDDIERAIIIFLGVGALSLVSAIFLTKSTSPFIGILHWVRRIEYFAPFFIGLFFFRKKKEETLEFFLKVLMLVLVAIFIYGVGQRYFNWPVIITQNEEFSKGIALRWIPGSHINSTFAGHYDLATFLVYLLPVFVGFYFFSNLELKPENGNGKV